jgi:hypothetical protein
MVDYESSPTKRDVPKGLDFFAAMGVTPAEKILIDNGIEVGEAKVVLQEIGFALFDKGLYPNGI